MHSSRIFARLRASAAHADSGQRPRPAAAARLSDARSPAYFCFLWLMLLGLRAQTPMSPQFPEIQALAGSPF